MDVYPDIGEALRLAARVPVRGGNDINQLIRVVWDDSGSFDNDEKVWRNADEIVRDFAVGNFFIVTVGYKVWENSEDLLIAQSADFDGDAANYSGVLRIIKRNIITRDKLTYGSAA